MEPGRVAAPEELADELFRLIEIARAVGVDPRDVSRQLRRGRQEIEKGQPERAGTRLRNARAALVEQVEHAFVDVLDALDAKVREAKENGHLVGRAELLVESARTALGLGDVLKAYAEVKGCMKAVGQAVEGPAPEATARSAVPAPDAEYEALRAEVARCAEAGEKFGFRVSGIRSSLEQAAEMHDRGDRERALSGLRAALDESEKVLAKVTPRVKAAISYDSSSLRVGEPARVRVSVKNDSRAVAKEVRLRLLGPLECEPLDIGLLKGGLSFQADLTVRFTAPGEVGVRVLTTYGRMFDGKMFEHAVEGKVRVSEAAATGKQGG